jgi:hypothetical protein
MKVSKLTIILLSKLSNLQKNNFTKICLLKIRVGKILEILIIVVVVVNKMMFSFILKMIDLQRMLKVDKIIIFQRIAIIFATLENKQKRKRTECLVLLNCSDLIYFALN